VYLQMLRGAIVGSGVVVIIVVSTTEEQCTQKWPVNKCNYEKKWGKLHYV